MIRRWLQPWAEAVLASPAFAAALDVELAADAAARAGIDIRHGFALLPDEAGTSVAFEPDGTAGVPSVLVAVAFGYDVRIQWRCAAHPGERLAATDPLPAARGCRLQATWVDLPASELRARYSGPVEQPFKLGARAFAVEAWLLHWPDVTVQVQLAGPNPDPGAGHLLARVLSEAAAAWNEATPTGQTIDFVHDPCRVTPDAWEISIDLGDSAAAGLDSLLAALDAAVPNIRRVVLRSYATAEDG